MFIGDKYQGVASAYVSSFADDNRAAYGIDTVQDVADLQADLNAVYQWDYVSEGQTPAPTSRQHQLCIGVGSGVP